MTQDVNYSFSAVNVLVRSFYKSDKGFLRNVSLQCYTIRTVMGSCENALYEEICKRSQNPGFYEIYDSGTLEVLQLVELS